MTRNVNSNCCYFYAIIILSVIYIDDVISR